MTCLMCKKSDWETVGVCGVSRECSDCNGNHELCWKCYLWLWKHDKFDVRCIGEEGKLVRVVDEILSNCPTRERWLAYTLEGG